MNKCTYSIASTFGTGAVSVQQVYRLNSPYDPDLTGVGTTAAGYEWGSTYYQRYRVNAAKVTIALSAAGGATGQVIRVIMAPLISTTSFPSAYGDFAASRGAVDRIFAYQSNGIITFRKYYKMQQLYGGGNVRSDPNFEANVGTNPTNSMCVGLWFTTLDGSVIATDDIQMHVKIVYYTTWYNRKTNVDL